jgi:L-methionine (R)-S-oxide reductase
MSGTLHFESSVNNRADRYAELIPQLSALLVGENDAIACMANVVAAIREAFPFFWIGFYRVVDQELVLGPFQGSIACTRIALGRGVCGAAWQKNETLLVPDVDAFPGHIACSSLSRSEIVVPVRNAEGNVIAILDIDSDQLNDFGKADQLGLEQICDVLGKHLSEI